MKKLLLITLMMFSLQFAFATFPPPVAESAATAVNTTANAKHLTHDQQRILMEQFTKMSVKDYETLSGHKMNVFEKLSFKLTKNRMKHQLKKDNGSGLFSDFNVGGFLLGLLLGLIGVLLAYIFSSDSNLQKWSWIGVGVAVILALLFII